MAGQVKHTKIFGGVVPDLTMLSVLTPPPLAEHRRADCRRRGRAARHGIELLDSTALLPPLLATPGVLTSRAPTDDERHDFAFGYRMADAIAGLDIGQTIAVKDQAVVAVEAMEGTDEMIARAGDLAGPGVTHREGGQAEAGHALRRAGRRAGHHRGDARAPGATALSIDAGQDAHVRSRGVPRRGRRGRHRRRRPRAAAGE